ncbi:hypothetical protein, partial [Candidatus Seribacter sulfatis]|uniref:hypothetical protein n=1 Tax=Candidatus Seribacter sulfatis TaxID=3381756 RepID=UPI00389A191D
VHFYPHVPTVLSRLTSHPCRSTSKKKARPMARIRLHKYANSSKAGNFKSNDYADLMEQIGLSYRKYLASPQPSPKT